VITDLNEVSEKKVIMHLFPEWEACAVNKDYSMGSALERFLLTSCDASKKQTCELFYASQRMNKNRSDNVHLLSKIR